MNTIQKLILVASLTLSVASMQAQSIVVGGYPLFVGSIQHQGPVPDNLSNATLNGTSTVNGSATITNGTLTVAGAVTITGPITNTAALSRVANPLTTGGLYTNPASSGFLRVNVLYTNLATAYLTNISTGDSTTIGSLGGGAGTNYASVKIRVGPSEVVVLTNFAGNVSIISSEWRN